MRAEYKSLERDVPPRVAVLALTLFLCVVAAIAFHKYSVPPDTFSKVESIEARETSAVRTPPDTVSNIESIEALETSEVRVEVPREFLETPGEYLETDVSELISIRQPDDW